jgi:hypothetical protein
MAERDMKPFWPSMAVITFSTHVMVAYNAIA